MIAPLVDYPELCEPRMTFSEIVDILSRLSNDELATLDDDKFSSAIITLYH
jgi:hypothetical protein